MVVIGNCGCHSHAATQIYKQNNRKVHEFVGLIYFLLLLLEINKQVLATCVYPLIQVYNNSLKHSNFKHNNCEDVI